jgi:hypothetical protein
MTESHGVLDVRGRLARSWLRRLDQAASWTGAWGQRGAREIHPARGSIEHAWGSVESTPWLDQLTGWLIGPSP